MDWWNDLTDWTSSDDGWRVLSGAIIPFVAIVVAGVIAALIGRGATKRVVAMHDRESRNAAVSGIVSAARKAATWGSLGHDERAYADHLAEDADIRLRLLPVSGAPLAANWAQHEIADIKKNSSTFSFQAEQSLAEFRDRMLEWQARPNRARKLFKADLERWKFDSPDPDADLIARQQDWNADQADKRDDSTPTPAPAERPTPTTTALRPGGPSSPASSVTPGGSAAPSPEAATAGGAAAGAAAGGFTVGRTGQGSTDRDATTPIADGRSGDNATRPYSDGATTPLSGAPVRPPLGSPIAPGRNDLGRDDETRNDKTRNDVGRNDRGAGRGDGSNAADTEAVDDRPGSAPRVASPTAADAHVNRAPARTGGDLDGSGTNTTSIPTRITSAPAEPTDADETDESPYTQPISASELRRRAADDDD